MIRQIWHILIILIITATVEKYGKTNVDILINRPGVAGAFLQTPLSLRVGFQKKI